MRDELLQLQCVVVGQTLHSAGLEHRAAETPAQTQLATVHLTVDAEGRSQRRFGTLRGARAVSRWGEQRVLRIETAVELAQIIEDDAALRQQLQRMTRGVAAQIAKRAITDALVGHRAQLFLDGHDRIGKRVLR